MKERILFLLLLFTSISTYSQDIESILGESLFPYDALVQNEGIQSKLNSEFTDKRIFFIAELHELAINPEYQFFFLKYLHKHAGVQNIFTEYSYGNSLLINKYLKTGNIDYLKSTTDYKYELFRKHWLDIYNWNKELPPNKKISVYGIGRHNWSIIAPLYYCISDNQNIPLQIETEIKTIQQLFNSNKAPTYYDDSFTSRDNQKLRKTLKKKLEKYPSLKSYFGSNYEHVYNIVYNPAAYKATDASMYLNFENLSKNSSGNVMVIFGTYHCFRERWGHSYDPIAKLINESETYNQQVYSTIGYYDKCTSARGIMSMNDGLKPFINPSHNKLLIEKAFSDTDFSILNLDNIPKGLLHNGNEYANLLFLMKNQKAIY